MTIMLREPDSIEAVRDTVHAIVATGDYSKLTDAQKGDLVVQLCKASGLNPLVQPFAFLKLQGKLVLYANRNCGDQLAAQHRITRKIVKGPEIIDVNGKKLVICTCEASTPDGRVEHATATVDLADPCGIANVYMKAETKAKRRAALAITGLSILDETEARDAARDADHDVRRTTPDNDTDVRRPDPRGSEPRRPDDKPRAIDDAAASLVKAITAAKRWADAVAMLPADTDPKASAAARALVDRLRRGLASADAAGVAQARSVYAALPDWVRYAESVEFPAVTAETTIDRNHHEGA